jgi:hypothetical protein
MLGADAAPGKALFEWLRTVEGTDKDVVARLGFLEQSGMLYGLGGLSATGGGHH